ncbi:MAG: sensor histidine kinase, partial [Planctomycetota bacterium]
SQRPRVRVRGTITYVKPRSGINAPGAKKINDPSFSIHDKSRGVWVRVRHALQHRWITASEIPLNQLQPGVVVEIVGTVDNGGFGPVITPHNVRVVGESALPKPLRPDLGRLFMGGYVMRRLTVSGVVQRVFASREDTLSMLLETGVGPVILDTHIPPSDDQEKWVDARIRVTGIAGVRRNRRFQMVAPRIFVQPREDIEILRAAPEPFHSHWLDITEVGNYSPSGRQQHRVCLRGTLTYNDDRGVVFVQHENTGLRVNLATPNNLTPGTDVEVCGFIDFSAYIHELANAQIRATGSRSEIQPATVKVTEILEDCLPGLAGNLRRDATLDGRVVRLTGTVVALRGQGQNARYRMDITTPEGIVRCIGDETPLRHQIGSVVQVTGVSRVSYRPSQTPGPWATPESVNLLIRDQRDIVVLQHPPWWNRTRIAIAFAISSMLGIAGIIWALSLNRVVNHRTQQLTAMIRQRRDAAIEYQAAIRERTRLATNLHDTVLQTMAGLAYQIDACDHRATHSNGDTQLGLAVAKRMIQRGQDDLRNAVWALHCLPLESGSLADSLQNVAHRLSPNHDPVVQVRSIGEMPELPDFVAGNLLLVAQEAIHNAVKHANANTIVVQISWSHAAHRIDLRVIDDGIGFSPTTVQKISDGHFGIQSMRSRVDRLGGELQFEDPAGGGMAVCVSIPIELVDMHVDDSISA